MKKIFLLLILLSSTQVFAEKIDDCEDFYEIAKEVMTVRQSGMDQMEYRNSTKKQFGGVLKSMLTLNEAIIDVKEG